MSRDNRSIEDRPDTPPTDIQPSAYLTDGRRLFRVISGFESAPAEPVAILEDCRTLQVAARSPEDLVDMGMYVVRGPRAGCVSAPVDGGRSLGPAGRGSGP